MTVLAWGGIEFEQGYRLAFQLDYFKESLQWGTDYIIAAHTSKYEFVAQVRRSDWGSAGNEANYILYVYVLPGRRHRARSFVLGKARRDDHGEACIEYHSR